MDCGLRVDLGTEWRGFEMWAWLMGLFLISFGVCRIRMISDVVLMGSSGEGRLEAGARCEGHRWCMGVRECLVVPWWMVEKKTLAGRGC